MFCEGLMTASLSEEEKSILVEAMALDEDQLYAEIGQLAYDGALPISFSEMMGEGRRWVRDRSADLRTAICPERKAISSAVATGGSVVAAAQAAEVLGSQATGVSRVLLAALLVKIGIDTFCGEG